MANLPRYEVLLWVRSDEFDSFIRQNASPVERMNANPPEGYVAVRITYETMEMACSYVLGYNFNVFVVEPDELRTAVAERPPHRPPNSVHV